MVRLSRRDEFSAAFSRDARSGMDEAMAGVGTNAGLLCYGWHQSLFSYLKWMK
jgi:hypothetical protein